MNPNTVSRDTANERDQKLLTITEAATRAAWEKLAAAPGQAASRAERSRESLQSAESDHAAARRRLPS